MVGASVAQTGITSSAFLYVTPLDEPALKDFVNNHQIPGTGKIDEYRRTTCW
jgi:hypothetical protein